MSSFLCGAGLNFSYRPLLSHLRNVCKRRKHTALEPKQKCDDVTRKERKEKAVWLACLLDLDYENETKRSRNTMVETTKTVYFESQIFLKYVFHSYYSLLLICQSQISIAWFRKGIIAY